MNNQPLDTEKKRLKIFIALLFSLFLIMFVRLFYLTILRHDAQDTKKGIVPERGQILDRNIKKLALSIKVYSIFCNALETAEINPGRTADISRLLDISEHQLRPLLRSGKSFVWLKRQVDYYTLKKVLDLRIKGIYYIKEYKRFYPNVRLASHVLGIVGVDNSGLEGVELYYDKYLNAGLLQPEENLNIVLSLDKNIQYIVETELRRKVREVRARGGTAIIMEPDTGYIIAMVNIPDFDPNLYLRSTDRERRNIAISDTFEPGSIFKIFSAATVYSENVIKGNEQFFCNGHIVIGDKTLSCWKKHGLLDFHQVIKDSCNVGMTRTILKISPMKFYDYLRNFGIGNYTGIDLPGEVQGSLRKPKGMGAFSEAAISLGQEVGVTSIQLISAACSVFNNGKIMEPKIVKAIVRPDGTIYKKFEPIIVRQVLSAAIADKVAEDLIGVVEEGGTGDLAYVKNFLIAGKTGTGEIYDRKIGQYNVNRVNSSFIGFFPAKKAKYAILITIHEPGSPEKTGGKVAAPVFKNIVDKIIAYEAIPNANRIVVQSKESTVFPYQKARQTNREERLPDLREKNMRDVLNTLKLYDVKISLIGTGIAYKQQPAPGTPVRNAMAVTVWFKTP
ncbi:MAG: penicillin-binding transpeptidase domain-containing protein [bacterium]|nr:penicillin-binding transpeptidase domain-containing protein [bacterium]